MKKFLLASVLGVSLILLLAACGDDSNNEGNNDNSGDNNQSENNSNNGDSANSGDDSLLAQLQEEGKVTIGFANEKPYAYQEDGELKGAAVDIAAAVFAELGIEEMESQLSDFGQLIPGLNAGKFDVVTAGMAINPDRCEQVDFGEPEMVYGEGLVVQKGNPLDLHSYADIAESGATVSIMSGATENEYVKSEGVEDSQIQAAADIPATFSAVASGRADATTGTEMTLRMALETSGDDLEFVENFEQPDIEGIPSYGAAAFHQDNDELREAYNEKLAELKADGTVAKLLEQNGFLNNEVPEDITTAGVCSGDQY
ncbi:ectoine/hydroxyectoine ABC transporter substrate-binding protein EhuB [Ornithinibacillus halophilus]|uniref:Amino acid ABC transporter substrate-binding protein, PAAT family n=1 Tax=Ornithinibacillus halophilus TaxID=930117 RepID=A0A1M5GZJ1_9BACI|nr:ectoine/hydroxyectoine ABC transporter substrate-binding protein EhuB [Ornithinibacillus halophilus]SHG09154.1 amino acid ABC transporter substrate-binding protein, PAAT family [Ornithinibacillus halophilus]